MDGEDPRTIGARLRQIRKSQEKSLEVIAGLAGMSAPTLSRIENGKRPLDRRSEIVALADALRVAPSELTELPESAPANGHTDSAIKAVHYALVAADLGYPCGQVVPVKVLRAQVAYQHRQRS